MNVWQTLGLVPNSDLQAIKQAYALKIKQYRPDSHPEQFQQIHQAYKELTALLRRQTKNATANTESTAPRHTAFSHGLQFSQANANERVVLDEPSGSNEHTFDQLQQPAEDQRSDAELCALQLQDESERRPLAAEQARQQYQHQRWQEQQAFEQAMAELLQQVDENLSDLNKLKRLQPWLFLTKSTWVLDGEFNQQLSAAMLQRLVAYHKNPLTSRSTSSKGRKRHLKQPVPISVLHLLDQIFNWSGQKKWLLRGPDPQILAEIFERLELEIEEAPVDVLRGNAQVLLNEQAPAPQQRQFDWGSLIPWLTLIAIVGQAFKYWQGH